MTGSSSPRVFSRHQLLLVCLVSGLVGSLNEIDQTRSSLLSILFFWVYLVSLVRLVGVPVRLTRQTR